MDQAWIWIESLSLFRVIVGNKHGTSMKKVGEIDYDGCSSWLECIDSYAGARFYWQIIQRNNKYGTRTKVYQSYIRQNWNKYEYEQEWNKYETKMTFWNKNGPFLFYFHLQWMQLRTRYRHSRAIWFWFCVRHNPNSSMATDSTHLKSPPTIEHGAGYIGLQLSSWVIQI